MSAPEDVTIELASDLDAPAVSRRFVQAHSDHLPAELMADAALLVTELVTNAVLHGAPRVTVRVRLDPPLLGVLVYDGGAALPSTRGESPDDAAPRGRGLFIVDRLSSDWGVIPATAAPGKTVWFELTASNYEGGHRQP